ncbi:hypothetical protein BYT27DRAFT_7154233 [Phlegmacium glaucopus]|nr:hypothetical protein BYT27DRAFT_7154233 [Phlegmacium glaucopus]
METGFGLDSSPFTTRLNSNYAATDSESLEIQTLLKVPTSRLEELSIRLQELDEQYSKIQSEQTSLLLSISEHRALISLVRKLPIEILQEIFVACLPTTHNAVMCKEEPPILLTQICSSWRNIAHSTPQLWKSIHIAVPCTTPGMYATGYANIQSVVEQVFHRRSEAVLEWITRSAACPLDISLSISLTEWENSLPDGFYDRIIEYLIRFSERWKEISFSAPYQALVPVAALPPSKVPLLESLSLNCSRLHFTSDLPTHLSSQSVWKTSGVMKAPKLRGICLTQLHEDATRLPINWSQLTNLSLEGTSWNTSSLSVPMAYKILSSCRNLICCRLDIGIIMDNEEPAFCETSTALVSLPFLTRLSVREGASLAKLFTLLHLPSLTTLEFHTAIWPTSESNTGLLTLLMLSQSMIRHLITDPQFFKRQDFIRCLRLCPLLKSLTIRRSQAMSCPPPPWPQADIPTCGVDDAFLNMFTSSSSSDVDNSNDDHGDEEPDNGLDGPLCPNLEIFESSSETEFSETTLLQFVKRKNGNNGDPPIPGLAKLKTLFIVFRCHRLDEIKSEIELHKQAGLKATILFHPPIPFMASFSPFDGLPNRVGYFYS